MIQKLHVLVAVTKFFVNILVQMHDTETAYLVVVTQYCNILIAKLNVLQKTPNFVLPTINAQYQVLLLIVDL